MLSMRKIGFVLFILFLSNILWAQQKSGTGNLSGSIIDKNRFNPLSGISITLVPGNNTTLSDSTGFFRFRQIQPGTYNLIISGIGYQTKMINNLIVSTGNENVINVELETGFQNLDAVVVSGRKNSARVASLETPLSVQKLTIEEIKRNPGGNFDISKVVQSLPGVGGGVGGGGFRNDLVIRGGAPSENVYYLDGIEIPVLNHFGTQGSGGGPQGILNANFIEEVKLSSSAFDARYDNVLSSVLQFKQKTGNKEKTQGNIILSATDLALTFDGPISKKTTYLASVRRSYLQFLFQALDLPIRPNYWDYQFKTNTRLNEKTSLSLLGLGAIDDFRFAAPKSASPEKLYILNSNPIIHQWNYTLGASLRRLTPTGYWNLSLSRNVFNNDVKKFENNNQPSAATQTLKTDSRETENKLRWDATVNKDGWKITYGASLQLVNFSNQFFGVVRKELRDINGNIIQPAVKLETKADIDMVKYGVFLQVSKKVLEERLALSAGMRMDGNDLENGEPNPFKQLSPRISLSYAISEKWNVNASTGIYYKLPSYTQLAYQSLNPLIDFRNPGKYIRNDHWVAGVEYLPSNSFRVTVEAFMKHYSNYPVSLQEGISLANKGSEFGSIGNEPVDQKGKGRVKGMEVLIQQKLTKRLFGVISYTLYQSEFSGLNGNYIPASWDNRHLLAVTGGYKFKRNWEMGLKFRYQGAAPYTPFDLVSSQLNYLSQGVGILDFSKYNTLRLKAFHAADIRIDKKWNFKKYSLNIFLDYTNFTGAKSYGVPQFTFKRTEDGSSFLTNNGQPMAIDGGNAIPLILANADALGTPSFGVIVEF